jgi:hypothetical protein
MGGESGDCEPPLAEDSKGAANPRPTLLTRRPHSRPDSSRCEASQRFSLSVLTVSCASRGNTTRRLRRRHQVSRRSGQIAVICYSATALATPSVSCFHGLLWFRSYSM